MPNYRRADVDGGSYFFTVVTYGRRPVLCDRDVRLALRESIQLVRIRWPFTIDAWVLMPEHMHCIWTLPPGDSDYSRRWSVIKRLTSQASTAGHMRTAGGTSRHRRKEGGLWQRRFWEHCIRDQEDFVRCRDYLHWNPVRHGYTGRVADWPYSTFHRWVRDGVYPADWGGDVVRRIDGCGLGE
jgi:putative transposase